MTLVFASIAACGSPYRDATQIDGIWVGNEIQSCADWSSDYDPAYCRALVAFAWSRARASGPIPDRVRYFAAPNPAADGTILDRGAAPIYVVFEQPTGEQEVVTVLHPSDETLSEFGYPGPRHSP